MEIRTDVCLAPYTTLKVGGVAKYLVEVGSSEELQQVRQFAQQIAAPVLVLGSGSNMLINDAGFAGVVLRNCIKGVGCVERAEGVVAVRVGTTGEVRIFTNAACEFAYRDSYFKTPAGRDWAITRVIFVLSTRRAPQLQYGDLATLDPDTCTLQSIRAKVIEIRSSKFPDWHQIGTAGSFFKNPIISAAHRDQLLARYPELPTYPMEDGQYKVALGWVLDRVCGLRGHTVGAVGLYEAQALVLVNTGDSASAIEAFAADVQSMVQAQTDIEIEPEVRFV